MCTSCTVCSQIWLNLLEDNHNFFLHLAMDDHHFSYIKEFLGKNMAPGLYTTTKRASLESEKGECTRPLCVFRFIFGGAGGSTIMEDKNCVWYNN